MQTRAKREKVAENSMNTEVGKLLSLLPPNYRFGKHFLEQRLADPTAIPKQITLNYLTEYDLGMAVGFLTGKGYKLVVNEKNEFTLVLCVNMITLLKKVPVFATDFDELDYSWIDQCFVYQGQPLSDELRFAFCAGRCTLTFSSKDSPSSEKRQALMRYINSGWTIFDQQGQEVTFKDAKDATLALDPKCEWTVVVKKKEPELTTEGFHAELATLVAKYSSVLVEKK